MKEESQEHWDSGTAVVGPVVVPEVTLVTNNSCTPCRQEVEKARLTPCEVKVF